MNGALLINKHAGISSFGIIEELKRIAMKKLGCKHRDLPSELQKMGHGGTLDPFATGLLIVCMGRGVKLSRYFLGSVKGYEATFRFGETTVSGDPTGEISERSNELPKSLQQLQEHASAFFSRPYLQTPPMHSAKKVDGKPLYELARQGIEIEREPRLCHLYDFQLTDYQAPDAEGSVKCSSGTYIRTLAQDFARSLGSVGMLMRLHRTNSGEFSVSQAQTVSEIESAILINDQSWTDLPCFVPFDRLLLGYPRAEAMDDEAHDIVQGRQGVLFSILKRARIDERESATSAATNTLAIYSRNRLLAIAKRESVAWELERVFPEALK